MRIVRTIDEYHAVRLGLDEPVGFVPTMGYLHDGHLSLVRLARLACPSVVASIFVNPTQFAPTEDLADYPRDLERDLRLLEEEGADVVFVPEPEAVYPPGYDTWVEVAGLTGRLEGASRPTHFRGVTTVVTKLFHIVQPQRAYLGQKDAQQAIVLAKLIADLNFDIELIVGPTLREADGLAMSSRNTYLSPAERAAAPALRCALDLAETLYADGERSAERLRRAMMELLEAEALLQPEYVSVANPTNLQEVDTIDGRVLVSLAARLGKTRLIDNTVLPPGEGLIEEPPCC
jgi:pantoate--beta-alanine ligase